LKKVVLKEMTSGRKHTKNCDIRDFSGDPPEDFRSTVASEFESGNNEQGK
jgi:hypothetical protein